MFSGLDYVVLLAYFAGILSLGAIFYRRNRSVEQFTAAGGSLPGWLCGLSIFATYLSSISYLALPGKSFADNWNPLLYSLGIPPAAFIAVKYFVPLYRRSGEVSAYGWLETRFGLWARIYASAFYLIYQIARIGVVMYLMALPMAVIFGWDMRTLIIVTGIVVTLYSMVGGITAVIYADAIQAVVLIFGAAVALFVLLTDMPGGIAGGLSTLSEHAAQQGKFSLGEWSPTILDEPTVWIVLAFGFFDNLRNFGVDQSYVQRYIAASDDRSAAWSVWFGALLYVPISVVFLFIGTALFSYYQSYPERMDEVRRVVATQRLMQTGRDPSALSDAEIDAAAAKITNTDAGDRVFPYFIASRLPTGIRGLLIAAIFAAAMSTVSTSLNSSATLLMSDFYVRIVAPQSQPRSRLWVLRAATIAWGLGGTIMGLVLIRLTDSALDIWWTFVGVLGAAIVGLFLLGWLVPAARGRSVIVPMVAGTIIILWMTFSPSPNWPDAWGWLQSPFHRWLTLVIGPTAMVTLGYVMAGGGRIHSNEERVSI